MNQPAPAQSKHVERVSVYLAVFAALMVLLALTFLAGKLNLDRFANGLNLTVALVIAVVKAALVVLFFMHVKHGTRLTWLFAAAGFFWLLILLTMPFTDFATRPERRPVVAHTRRYMWSEPDAR